jgi:hypothetical protein
VLALDRRLSVFPGLLLLAFPSDERVLALDCRLSVFMVQLPLAILSGEGVLALDLLLSVLGLSLTTLADGIVAGTATAVVSTLGAVAVVDVEGLVVLVAARLDSRKGCLFLPLANSPAFCADVV